MQRRWEVIEVPTVPAAVIKHLIVARICPPCRERLYLKANMPLPSRSKRALSSRC